MADTPQSAEPELVVKITPALVRRVIAHLGGKKSRKKMNPAKRRASRENGKLGGRPKKAQMEFRLK